MIEYSELPPTTLAYAAGLIDGEGCIRVGKYHDTRNGRRLGFRGQLSIGMTDRKALEWLRDTLGGNFYLGRTSYDRTKAAYNWTMRTTDAARLLTAILPYLIIKREQALMLIEFAATLHQPGKWGRAGLPSSLLAHRAGLAARSLELNKKGPTAP